MKTKSVISLSTGLEDAEKVTVALLVAVGSAEGDRPTLMFLTKEAVRLVVGDVSRGTACEGCPPLEDLMRRYPEAGVTSWSARSASTPSTSTRRTWWTTRKLGGTVPMWGWIGDEPANTFSC